MKTNFEFVIFIFIQNTRENVVITSKKERRLLDIRSNKHFSILQLKKLEYFKNFDRNLFIFQNF